MGTYNQESIREVYSKGFRDGVRAGSNADIKIKIVQAMKNTKGIGDIKIKKVLETLKLMEVENE